MIPRARFQAALALAAACLAGQAAPGAQAGGLPESNLSLLDRTLVGAVRKVLAQAPVAPGSRMALVKATDAPLALDVERAVLAALTERRVDVWVVPAAAESAAAPVRVSAADLRGGRITSETLAGLQARQQQAAQPAARSEVFDPGTSTAGALAGVGPPEAGEMPLLSVRVEEARVDYPRLFRSGLFGGPYVERRALSRVSAQLLRPGSRAVYWVGAADTSIADHVARSEVRMLEDPNRPETKGTVPSQGWQKVAEPALVVALIAGLVSLFYTNRP